jgi:trimeric autotransporter adhesin
MTPRRTSFLLSATSALWAAAAWAQPCAPEWQPMPSGTAPNFDILALLPWQPPGSHRGVLVAGGSFWQLGPQQVHSIASWDGLQWTPYGTGLAGGVRALTPYAAPGAAPELIAGGWFSLAGSVPLKAIARWDGSAWQQLGGGLSHTNPAFGYPFVNAMASFSGDLLVSVSMRAAGNIPVQTMARWDGLEWHAVPDERYADALHIHQGELFAAGYWVPPGSTSSIGVIRWTGQEWLRVGGNTPQDCFALGTWDDKLIATGPVGIAAWDGTTWQNLGAGIGGTGRALASFRPGPGHPELLIVGGSFASAGGQPAARIAAWNGQNWQALGAGVNDRVEALAEYRGQLYVGGWFTRAGGMSSPYLARWGCPQPPPCWANCDDSTAQPILNVEDFTCFMSEFAAGMQLPPTQQVHHYTNCDHSTVPPALNVEDFTCFINQFAQGCR